jgi:hypothetical protein
MTSSQIKVFRHFGEILFIDATYKANIYGVPLVQCIAIDSFGHIRHIAAALTRGETQSDYVWVLQQLHRATNVRPRVTLSDRAQSITNALAEVFGPPTIHLKCSLHIKNNLMPKLPDKSTWSLKQLSNFKADFRFVVYSTTAEAFELRMNKLISKCQPFPVLSSFLIELQGIQGQWAMYARHNARSVYEATSVVEAAYAIFKNLKEFKLKRLSDVIMRSFVLAHQQYGRSLQDSAQSRVAASQQPLISSLNNIFTEVRSKLTDYAVKDLFETLKDVSSFYRQQPLDIGQFEELVARTKSLYGNLLSDSPPSVSDALSQSPLENPTASDLCVQDIPPRVVRMARADNALIYVIVPDVQGSRPTPVLIRGSHVVVFDRTALMYACTCGKETYQGFLCAHYLSAFKTSHLMWHHMYMWHPRWFREPQAAFHEGTLVAVQSTERVEYLPADISAEILQRSAKLMKPFADGPVAPRQDTPSAQVLDRPFKKFQQQMTLLNAIASSHRRRGDVQAITRLADDLTPFVNQVRSPSRPI